MNSVVASLISLQGHVRLDDILRRCLNWDGVCPLFASGEITLLPYDLKTMFSHDRKQKHD